MAQSLDRVEVYYKWNRVLLSLIGFWPCHTSRESRLARINLLLLAISLMIPLLLGLFKVREDSNMVIECMPTLGTAAICLTKVINLTRNSDKLKDLLIVIQEDWRNTISTPEIEIVKKSAKQGLRLSKMYTINFLVFGSLFSIQPIIEDTFAPNTVINGTKLPKRLTFITEYYIDTDKYFYPIIVHSYVAIMALLAIFMAADSMFVVYVHHGCTKFQIFKYRLSQVIQLETHDLNLHPEEIKDLVFNKIKICIHLHKEAIGYADAIESSYTICQFFQVGIGCLIVSIAGVHATTKLNEPDHLAKYAGVIFSHTLHLLFYSWMSQKLMDESLSVSEAIYSMEWYRVSLRSRKLLLQMMTRCIEPCKLTAGRLTLMSMENFSKVMKQAMSFFTVLSSVQEPSTLSHNE